jgi:ParG
MSLQIVTGKKPLRVDLPPDLHTAFKVACAQRQRSMADVITSFIEGYVQDHVVSLEGEDDEQE